MATMHSTICALDQGLEPKTIARGKTIQRIVHKTRTIGQEDKRETTWTQSITTRVPVKLYRMDGWMDVWIYIYMVSNGYRSRRYDNLIRSKHAAEVHAQSMSPNTTHAT